MSGGVGLVARALSPLCLGWNNKGCRYGSVNRDSGEAVVYYEVFGESVSVFVYRVRGAGAVSGVGICLLCILRQYQFVLEQTKQLRAENCLR